MAKETRLSRDNHYDLSHYVVVWNMHSSDSSDVTRDIYENIPYRVQFNSEGTHWIQIIIKYPNARIAIREAITLHRLSRQNYKFLVNMAVHALAIFAKLEFDCSQSWRNPTAMAIKNFPQRITASRWKMLLSKFGKVLSMKYNSDGDDGNHVVVKYETMAEAMGAVIALHEFIVDGRRLNVKTLQKEKEIYLLSAFRDKLDYCRCVTDNCRLHPVLEGSNPHLEDKNNSDRPSLCTFCHYPDHHPTEEESYDAEFMAKFDDSIVQWEDEFPEFKEDLIIGNDWLLIEEDEDDGVPHVDDDSWEVVYFSDLTYLREKDDAKLCSGETIPKSEG